MLLCSMQEWWGAFSRAIQVRTRLLSHPLPFAFLQPLSLPGLRMAELSPALESGFTAQRQCFLPFKVLYSQL